MISLLLKMRYILINENPKWDYQINNTVITSKENVKDLGVHIATNLFCREIARKANYISYIFFHYFKSHDGNLYMYVLLMYMLGLYYIIVHLYEIQHCANI